MSVIIVGAGLAGLAAAEALDSKGCTVTIVEARNKIGGRISTVRMDGNNIVDAGA